MHHAWVCGSPVIGWSTHVPVLTGRVPKAPFIATQLNSTRRRVELRRRSVYSDADTTRLNSTPSCRHVHSVPQTPWNLDLFSHKNPVTPLETTTCHQTVFFSLDIRDSNPVPLFSIPGFEVEESKIYHWR